MKVKKSQGIVCPKCGSLNPKGEDFCLTCTCDMLHYEEKKKRNIFPFIIGIMVIIVIVSFMFIFSSFKSTYISAKGTSSDGKCDICKESAVCTLNGEEYCEKHAYEAGAYYLGLD